MKKLTIGVDVDGVLADFTEAARSLCKEKFNGRPDDKLVQTGWGFDSLGLTKAEEDAMWEHIDNATNWWYSEINPLADAQLLRFLCDEHRVIFITNRKDAKPESGSMGVEKQTAFWLTNYFNIHAPTVLLSKAKGPLAAALKLDAFIDDRDKNLEEVIDAIGPEKVWGLRATYTPKALLKSHPNWVDSFDEFAAKFLPLETVCEFAKDEIVDKYGSKYGVTYSLAPGVCIA